MRRLVLKMQMSLDGFVESRTAMSASSSPASMIC
jgi:hypothetical protein